MKKKLFSLCAWAATLFVAAAMTSCVSENDAYVAPDSEGGNVYISIKTETITDTRGTVITTNPTTTYENYLGQTLICLFDGDGNLVEYKDIPDLETAEKKTTFRGQTYAAGYKVAVASNLPTAVHTAIKAKLDANATTPYTLDLMKAETMDIAQALNSNVLTTTDADRRIPMFGEGTLVANDADYYVSIPVWHSITKVTLNELHVDFAESKTRGASFTPDEVFLTNVPDVVNLESSSIKALDFASNKLYHGDDALTYVASATGAANEVVKADAATKKVFVENHASISENIIGTDVMTAGLDELSNGGQSAWGEQYYFYTLPNDLTDDNEATYIVVSGMFNPNDGSDASRVYYRAKLNGYGNSKLEPNKNYKVNMIIRGIGGTDAYTDGADPTAVEAFVTTTSFTDVEENAVLGVGAGVYTAMGKIVKVGDILFSDGEFKGQSEALAYHTANTTAANGVYPVGIVFHLLNAAEQVAAQYNGKTGLVMALKDASPGVKWAAASENAGLTRLSLTSGDNTTVPADEATLRRTVASEMKDLTRAGNNGLLNWSAIVDKTSANAFKAVVDFDQDENSAADDVTTLGTLATSGWYLPSIGEFYKMTYSLGKLETALMNTSGAWGNSATDGDKTWNWTPWGMYYTNGSATRGVADIVRDNINAMIDACGNGTYTAFEGGKEPASSVYYWSSSEWSAVYAFILSFCSNGNLYFSRYYAKSDEFRVHPVLAF